MRFETRRRSKPNVIGKSAAGFANKVGAFALYLFVLVLGYWRKTFAKFATSIDKVTLQRCHVETFAFFDGIPSSATSGGPTLHASPAWP